ncbi:protein ROLLING AND ERECT LEAF 2-like [Phoenix dactylifera]|uniref:Protein ROLLING AND ERECT LEAF 2-like n=1 Tax=Phoenix dactylifera TaxID=42345 RepID=A0A8B7D5Z0_PHODC|nr:protein ROLLING AND ERECT LEAF 2-like [Phoenix dactylifera]
MGCTASRLDNEDTVRRCKERRRFMKEAADSRHHLASAHSEYLNSLRLTGSALTRFAQGEPLAVSDHTPPILLLRTHPNPPPFTATSLPPPTPQPPPAPPRFFPSPSPSPTIASSKLPHILSDSNPASTPSSFRKPPPASAKYYPHLPMNSTYATTPSQSSSAWDWENFYPPSPPDSDFFDRRKAELEEINRQRQHHHLPREEVDKEEEGIQGEREEIHCRDWDEHYSGTTSSTTECDGENEEEEERESRSDGIAARSDYGGSDPSRAPPSEIGSSAAAEVKTARREMSEAGSSSAGWNGREDVSSVAELKMVLRHRNLAEIVAAIEEYFVKVADAGEGISNLLETGRAQFERSFRQLKKTVYHSNSVLSALSSSWTSKPPLAIKYRLDTGVLDDSGGGKSHGSTLERLLAWEKKLYEEVKTREGVKIEHEKKLSTLQNQEYKGKEDAKLDKTKASIKKLQSLIIVTSQAVTTTSSAIIRVRDNELAPQLVEICYGLLNMWRSMHQFHEVQNHIVQQVHGLVNRSSAGEPTSDLHRLATRDLEAAVSAWHSSFNRLVKYQRDYVRALYSWLRLTLYQVSSDNPQKDHSSPISLELTAFCDEWKQALDRLPDTVASEAIKSFMNVIHVIYTKQAEELKIKKRAEAFSKELEKKSASLRSIEKKYYQSYSMVGMALPGSGNDNDGQVFDTRDPLAEKKSEIAACRRKVEDEMMRHAKAVEVTRSMTLNNIQTGLPGVFQAMTGFSDLFVQNLEVVCRRAGSVK